MGRRVSCRLGLYVTALGDFDLEASSFGADLRLWSLCPAAAGDLRPLATADLTNGMHVARGEIRTEQKGDRIYAHQRITGRFWHHWHVVTFPFDRHRLDITVEDTVLDRSLFRYEPDTVQSGLHPSFHLPGWRVAGFEVVEEPHPYPRRWATRAWKRARPCRGSGRASSWSAMTIWASSSSRRPSMRRASSPFWPSSRTRTTPRSMAAG